MVPLFWLSLLSLTRLTPKGMAQAHSCLSQPSGVIWRQLGQDAVIQCSFLPDCLAENLRYKWFAFEHRSHGTLDLAQNHHKYSLHGADLQIRSLNGNDSGIYYCAATTQREPTPGAQHVGLGTTLVVKEKTKLMVGHVLLWLTVVVLALYSSATVTLIVQKKYGLNICNCRRTHKSDKKNTKRTRVFHDVLQEMHRQRNGRSKETAEKHPALVQAAAAQADNAPDDIYQNV
ncbi:immunoglobulin superfamily member 6 [Syngnathus typhle]|uniref:immunoglobulin superfamily member 6 n=1 Tax=Syngnathus typhle TaxID=161592 RepID=UPI002A6B1A8F|nr:immunoglobulin superfamily member 6 [Syngnathus typhle]